MHGYNGLRNVLSKPVKVKFDGAVIDVAAEKPKPQPSFLGYICEGKREQWPEASLAATIAQSLAPMQAA
jgi:hypothetical protein